MDRSARSSMYEVSDFWTVAQLGKLRRALTQKFHALESGNLETEDTALDMARVYQQLCTAENAVRFSHGLDTVGSIPDWVGYQLTHAAFGGTRDEV